MALGNKTEALENHKKSVKLNPGNEGGIKILKANLVWRKAYCMAMTGATDIKYFRLGKVSLSIRMMDIHWFSIPFATVCQPVIQAKVI